MFDAISKDVKNIGWNSKPISIKSHVTNINLNPLIIKLINKGKKVLKKGHGFDKAFNIFDEIDNNCYKLHVYNPSTFNMISWKNEMQKYLKIMEWKLSDVFSTPGINRKINDDYYKGYVNKKLNEDMNYWDTHHVKAILDSSKFKRLKKIKTEEPVEGD